MGAAERQLETETYGALIRLRTDPVGVRAEAQALKRIFLKLEGLLQNA